MHVITRSNAVEVYNEHAILARIIELSGNFHGLGQLSVDPAMVVKRVKEFIVDGIHTSEIDNLLARYASDYVMVHPDYMTFAGRITASNLHKMTPKSFSESLDKQVQGMIAEYKERGGEGYPKYINKSYLNTILLNRDAINEMIVDARDYIYTFSAYNQFKNQYLKKVNGVTVDRPQYLFMRIACELWMPRNSQREFIVRKLSKETLDIIKEYYDALSTGLYVHATPTILNSGFTGQLQSCFLMDIPDSLDGIFGLLKDCAMISKNCGGIGISASKLRSSGAYIAGTNGSSNGVVPHLKCYESMIKDVNQGGSRKGACAIYLADWHKDIIEFIELRNKSGGHSDAKCQNLFNALWLHELFFERLGEYYDLMSAGNFERATEITIPILDEKSKTGLTNMTGQELRDFLVKNEERLEKVKIESMIYAITDAMAQSGTPFLCNGDAAEFCSNMKNYGAIQSSNLCTEIFIPSREDSYACCTLANIVLTNMIRYDGSRPIFDFDLLGRITKMAIKALDRILDVNTYPVPQCQKNSMDLRPLGLGIQGLSDVFSIFGVPYTSKHAESLDKAIFETMYYNAVEASTELAQELGKYPYFDGSDLGNGKFHWEVFAEYTGVPYEHARKLPWESLREKVLTFGVRNATFLALMPTESTSKIMGCSPCIEPRFKHYYANDSDINGRVEIVNEHLIKRAVSLGLWTQDNINILESTGTFPFQGYWKDVFQNAYEVPIDDYIRRNGLRQYMVDQGISFNLHVNELNVINVIKQILMARKYGLKTINYYIMIKKVDKATLSGSRLKSEDQDTSESEVDKELAKMVCSRQNPESCFHCI